MRDADMLAALKNERDHTIFAQRAEVFVKRWSPDNPRERWEFTGELMSLFRDMVMTQQHVHQSVATHYFDQSMTAMKAQPMAPIIISKDEK